MHRLRNSIEIHHFELEFLTLLNGNWKYFSNYMSYKKKHVLIISAAFDCVRLTTWLHLMTMNWIHPDPEEASWRKSSQMAHVTISYIMTNSLKFCVWCQMKIIDFNTSCRYTFNRILYIFDQNPKCWRWFWYFENTDLKLKVFIKYIGHRLIRIPKICAIILHF